MNSLSLPQSIEEPYRSQSDTVYDHLSSATSSLDHQVLYDSINTPGSFEGAFSSIYQNKSANF